ncbi:MmcQ/YjbR family DNA-binding protein [Gordonia sp. (in: high G+C Gram-positive bacteria)]|uniref:MmcQ/YjbR family DNA-binding protein n=1 Tax=Gordonia sp. (in: high G+C Gram-positive bacteria) TaxID=84139 RepID=UPI0039E43FFD
MATFDDVRRLALALPQTSEKTSWGNLMFCVAKKGFVWERPLRKADIAALTELGREIPAGEVIGLRVADETAKHELIAAEPEVFFTIPHFDGYPAVLVRLDAIDEAELREMITDAWLDRAPKRVAAQFLADGGR